MKISLGKGSDMDVGITGAACILAYPKTVYCAGSTLARKPRLSRATGEIRAIIMSVT